MVVTLSPDDAGTAAATGWYGKLPSVGDFASRRLPATFIQAWDAWLATGLADWAASDPEGWLAVYLAAPSWRFLMMRGAGPASAPAAFAGMPVMAGVLMPSVDRVGRYFPLTLARALPRLPVGVGETRELLGWLHQTDDLAVDALHGNWSIDTLEAALAAVAGDAPGWFDEPPQVDPVAGRRASFTDWVGRSALGGGREWSPCADLPALLGAAASAGLADRLHGQVWWLCGDALGANHLRISDGLPEGAAFAELLGRRGDNDLHPFNPGDLP